MKEEPRELHIRVPAEVFMALRLMAAKQDTSLNALVNDAIDEYIRANPTE